MIHVLRIAALLSLVGCGLWGEDHGKGRHGKNGQRSAQAAGQKGQKAGPRAGQKGAAQKPDAGDVAPMPSPAATTQGKDAPRLVMLAVMDTVRADHTSLCGYERPTTPRLDKLSTKATAKSCEAYSPAPWTHPSHASMFTGKPVTEHAAMWVTESEVALNPVTKVRPLHDQFTTLAEQYKARGYQTIAVSANMILTPASGLLQGFDTTELTTTAVAMRGQRFRAHFAKAIANVDPSKPIFLFVNVYDAHDPYPAVPEGLDWITAQPRQDIAPNKHDESTPYYRYVKGLSEESEYAPFLKAIVNGYDWGIHDADENLGYVVDTLAKAGWLADARVAVTSDHGEMLGEHRTLRHGGYLYEPVVNVPFVYYDTTATGPVTLPAPFSTMRVYDLLMSGKVPDGEVVSVTERNDQDIQGGVVGGALWTTDKQKLQCLDGKRGRYDLSADPTESNLLELGKSPKLSALDKLCKGVGALQKLPAPKANDPALIEALKSVGYLE